MQQGGPIKQEHLHHNTIKQEPLHHNQLHNGQMPGGSAVLLNNQQVSGMGGGAMQHHNFNGRVPNNTVVHVQQSHLVNNNNPMNAPRVVQNSSGQQFYVVSHAQQAQHQQQPRVSNANMSAVNVVQSRPSNTLLHHQQQQSSAHTNTNNGRGPMRQFEYTTPASANDQPPPSNRGAPPIHSNNNQPNMNSNNIQQPQSNGTQMQQAAAAEDSNVQKCAKFFRTLLALSQQNQAGSEVSELVRKVISGRTDPETFTKELQQVLNSTAQPHLLPFLTRTLPSLRVALDNGHLAIDGLDKLLLNGTSNVNNINNNHNSNAINVNNVNNNNSTVNNANNNMPVQYAPPPQPTRVFQPSMQIASTSSQPIMNAQPNSSTVVYSNQGYQAQPQPTSTLVAQLNQRPAPQKRTTAAQSRGKNNAINTTVAAVTSGSDRSIAKLVVGRLVLHERFYHYDERFHRSFGGNREQADDDLNDVAAMGGVNLAEESQRIMASTGELLQTSTRQLSEPADQTLLARAVLTHRVAVCGANTNNMLISDAAMVILSLGVRERLSMLLRRLAVLAEHRALPLRVNPFYAPTGELRSQVRFLEAVDKVEQQRHSDKERQLLVKLSRSKAKPGTSEHTERAKNKAKEMQRVEQEEARNREANEAAQKALGQTSRKRAWQDSASNSQSTPMFADNPFEHSSSSRVPLKTQTARAKVKRVNVRDLQVALGSDRKWKHSKWLYRSRLCNDNPTSSSHSNVD